VGTDPAKVAIHRDVQLVLAKIGAYSKPVTGNQKDTQDAIMAFQKANGLKADGIIGKGTWGKVREKFEAQPRAAGN
jgi:peptidoglycan hydrolase-like protein with peptidoglycan-binding domain